MPATTTETLAKYQAEIDQLTTDFTNEAHNPERRKAIATRLRQITDGASTYQTLVNR